jgi:hypothetical protein
MEHLQVNPTDGMPNAPPDWLDRPLLNDMVRPCWKLPKQYDPAIF